MAEFQPPPTWASPVETDERTGKFQFNPVWLKWFLDLVDLINNAGGGSGISHNDTTGLQGGTANQFYHGTSAQNALLVILASASGITLHPPDDDGTAQTVCALHAGNGAPSNAQGANGDFYFRGDGAAATFIYHKAAGAWTAFA